MSKAGERMLEGAREALAIARGEQPAASITIKGHRYVSASWLPIESAPMDGSRVLVSWGNPAEDAAFCRWFYNERVKQEFWNDDVELDHYDNIQNPPKWWLPLPSLPRPKEK